MRRRYTGNMDGRGAAINVLAGVVIGASVPIVGAVVLARAHPEFEWLDHVFTIFMLCIACGGVGVVLNLPWAAGETSQASPIAEPLNAPSAKDYEFDSGDEPSAHRQERGRADERPDESTGQGTDEKWKERARGAEAATPTKRYAMSRREAMKTLELDAEADDQAVRDAFRRLAKEHHPDHATTQGAEAVEAATSRFRQIRAAYEVLIDDEPA